MHDTIIGRFINLYPELQRMAKEAGNEELFNMFAKKEQNLESLSTELGLEKEFMEYSKSFDNAVAEGNSERVANLMSEYWWYVLQKICLPNIDD